MSHVAAARGALYMLSVQPREQQVAEKPHGEHLYTSNKQTGYLRCTMEISLLQ